MVIQLVSGPHVTWNRVGCLDSRFAAARLDGNVISNSCHDLCNLTVLKGLYFLPRSLTNPSRPFYASFHLETDRITEHYAMST